MDVARVVYVIGLSFLVLWIPVAFINGLASGFIGVSGFIMFMFGVIELGDRQKKQEEKRMSGFKEKLYSVCENIKETDYIVETSRRKIMALESEKELLHFIFDKNKNDIESINFKNILEVHIVEDGTSITKTSRGSQIGGALVGGILAGGVGAVIGGLSGKTKTTKEVKKIELSLLVNDTENPIRRFTFFNHSVGVKTTNSTYIQMRSATENWYNRFKVIIHRQDQKDEKVNA